MTTDNIILSRKARWSILAITFTQFMLLYIIDEYRYSLSGELKAIFYSIIISVPTFAVLLLKQPFDKKLWKVIVLYSLVALGTSYYMGYQCTSEYSSSCSGDIWFQFIAPQFIAWFILLFFVQTWLKTGDLTFPYVELFNSSWGNYITGKLTFIFVMIFWGLLFLWTGLFNIIGVDFFENLFEQELFLYPVFGIATGIGVITFRTRINTIDLVLNILQVLIHWLLPVVAVMSLLFLMFLPFTGLEGLWDTGYATTMILWLVSLLLFFTNSVYQSGTEDFARGRIYDNLIKAALIASPAYLVLASFGLNIRVEQHGWTVDRLWVVIIIVVLFAFTLSYAYSLLRKRENWFYNITNINRVLAVFIAVLCLLVTSPIIDLRKISVSDQISRLKSGEIDIYEFDYEYLRFTTGRSGVEALRLLRDYEPIKNNKKQLRHMNNVLAAGRRWDIYDNLENVGELVDYIKVYPEGAQAPEGLLQLLFDDRKNLKYCFKSSACSLISVDIYGNNNAEYLLINDANRISYASVYGVVDKRWVNIGTSISSVYFKKGKLKNAMANSDFHAQESSWRTLIIGGKKVNFRDKGRDY